MRAPSNGPQHVVEGESKQDDASGRAVMSMGPPDADLRDGAPAVPLVVDLDQTLIRSDLLIETGIAYLARGPRAWWSTACALLSGKAALKAAIAIAVAIDPALLPYNADVLALIAAARTAGRAVYIASASHETYVSAIAAYLGLDGWLASSARENLLGATKRQRLVERFGIGGFDYVGDSRSDLDVWPAARRAIAIGPSASTRRQLEATHRDVIVIPAPDRAGRPWLTLLRPYRWALNALIFAPILLAQTFDEPSLVRALLTFVAFSITTSSISIFNDLIDIETDRRDPARRLRPLAAGLVSVKTVAFTAPALTLLGGTVAASVSWSVLGLVTTYVALALTYALFLKRKEILGTGVAACLITLRIVTGAVAVGVAMSAASLSLATLICVVIVIAKRFIARSGQTPL